MQALIIKILAKAGMSAICERLYCLKLYVICDAVLTCIAVNQWNSHCSSLKHTISASSASNCYLKSVVWTAVFRKALQTLQTCTEVCIARSERDGTCAETRFGLSAKRTSPFKSAGASVQSTAGSRGVRMRGSNGSNAGYTVFWGRVQDYWLPTPLACFPFTSPTVRHRVPSGFNWAILSSVSVYTLLPLLCYGLSTKGSTFPVSIVVLYRVIRNDCLCFNNLP